MSRTKKGSKAAGYEYWSRRPGSAKHGSPPGRDSKKETKRRERQRDKISTAEAELLAEDEELED